MASPIDLWSKLMVALRFMDQEATTRYADQACEWPSGLRQYHQHYRSVYGGRDGCEVSWAHRLAQLLGTQGAVVHSRRAMCTYPLYALLPGKKSQHVDLKIQVGRDEWLWLEIKGSWPVCFRMDSLGKKEQYVWSRFESYLLEDALEDFHRLERLHSCDAASVGVLIIGFDTDLKPAGQLCCETRRQTHGALAAQ